VKILGQPVIMGLQYIHIAILPLSLILSLSFLYAYSLTNSNMSVNGETATLGQALIYFVALVFWPVPLVAMLHFGWAAGKVLKLPISKFKRDS
jgi:hypothetical protein